MMKRIACSLIMVWAFISNTYASDSNDWSWQPMNIVVNKGAVSVLDNELLFSLDEEKVQKDLMLVALNEQVKQISLPSLNGKFIPFTILHDSIMAEPLQRKFPSIRSFAVRQVGSVHHTGRFDIGPNGVHGMYVVNGERVYLDTVDTGVVKLYKKTIKQQAWQDEVLKPEVAQVAAKNRQSRGPLIANGGNVDFVTYRLAVTTSDEYTSFFGGKVGAMNGIVTTINRVNEVFKTDLAVKLELIANNDTLIFEANDPYDNGNADDTLGIVQTQIDTLIGTDNYDVGHLMATSGAGLAGLGVVCSQSAKSWGMTGISTPQGDAYDVDYVAHEIGHQFGANHTYNGSSGSCNTRESSAAYEPGSGVTIMSYAGICGDDNLAQNSIAMFHSHSIDEMNAHVTTGSGSNCGTPTNIGNNAPIANANADHTIPINTPFVLMGSATDQNTANTLSYAWEQMDLGATTAGAGQLVDNGEGPLFRPYLPSSGAVRYFPRLEDVLVNTTAKGEAYPTTNRVMNFRLVVRDGEGGVNYDAMTVTSTTSAGPFAITAPTSATQLNDSSSVTVTWNVANTDQAPVSCDNVDIMQSTTSTSFDQVLVSNTPNDGSQTVNLAGSADGKARIMVKCSTGVFYALSQEFQLGNIISITGQQSLSMNEDASLLITPAMFTVVNEQADATLTVSLSSGSNYTINGETVTPSANFFGELTVPVKVSDGSNTSVAFLAKITVVAVNDAPAILGQQSISVNEDTSLTLTLSQFLVTDVDSSVLTLTAQTGDNYTLDGLTLMPVANYSGSLIVPISVADNTGALDNFSAQVTVIAVNDVPIATADNGTVVQGETLQLNVLNNDTDIDSAELTVNSVNYTGTGTVTISNNMLEYAASTDFVGQEQFTYEVVDGNGGSAIGEVTVEVTESNATPTNPTTPTDPSSGDDSSSSGALSFIWLLSLLMVFRRIRYQG
ncbi:reprolysin-like metallopeptidase [Pseudoalteromonas citrea]|nr:tandem-95 repeat protein [Pseudoalteromonas citrea]